MNRLLFLSVAIFLVAINVSLAFPIIQGSSIQPPSIWIGEGITAFDNCTDDSSPITQNYVSITGPSLLLPTFYFPQQFGSIDVMKDYFDRTGNYGATFYCTNSMNETNTSYQAFTVSKLTGYITSITPYPSYTGDVVEIDYMVKNDYSGNSISSNVGFNVTLNDQVKSLKLIPAYDMNKGWILKIDAPGTSGLYNLKVTAFYDRTSVTNYSFVDVRKRIDFGIDSIDDSALSSNDNITITLRALDKGSSIDLSKSNLAIRLNSVDATINSVSKRGELTDVAVTVPSLNAGSYRLDAFLSYGGLSYSDNRNVNYIVDVRGTMVDENSKAISSLIKFLQNGVTKQSVSTDSYGSYLGSIAPDTYDIDFTFPSSIIRIYGISVTSFDDPMKYYYGSGFDIPGIRNAGLYDYEFTMPFSSASIEVAYDEKSVVNENNLKIFGCSSWNSGRKICNSEWSEVVGQIDMVRNKARINTTTLSAFVVGEAKSISLDFNTDKDVYNVGEKISVRGMAKDDDRNSVANASIQAYLRSMNQVYSAKADSNGIFSIELDSPGYEGSYDLDVKSSKYPYVSYTGSKAINIVKSKDILIDFPDTVKASRGENITQTINVVNTGQADIDNLGFFMQGLQDEYYKVPSNISLKSGEEKSLSVDFFIPFYAQGGISSATLMILGGGISQEKVFGLNIASSQEVPADNQTTPTGYASGFSMPNISFNEVTYIVIFAALCFSMSIALKKFSISRNDRSKITRQLSDAKNILSSNNVRERAPEQKYDKVILTEFPNFLRFSKKLIKDDEDGKGN